ncbi:MAG: twin-arginine translocase subunit TatC [Candidatus Melainabacteria bacterium]|nr:twin-arginine translocase subunit TatC [Candidatus Melainabacteria bacterium]MBI3309598.1 twin-arginine translocase subunit TatC [Candidatus Melainabacteria bacterium]
MPVSTKELKLYDKTEEFDGGLLEPLTDHLTDLRNKIIISLIALCIGTLIAFTFSKEIIFFMTKIAPSGTTFLQIKPGEFFFTSLKISMYFGLVIALPVIIWQLASFILPGLNSKEVKIVVPVAMCSPVLFLFGSLVAYYFVAPSMLKFLFGFGRDVITTSISIESFISFALMITAMCGIIFLLPVIIFVLANGGILNSEILVGKWKYALLVCVILGAILTPTPDPFNMCIISAILISLYGLSIGILKLAGR